MPCVLVRIKSPKSVRSQKILKSHQEGGTRISNYSGTSGPVLSFPLVTSTSSHFTESRNNEDPVDQSGFEEWKKTL